MFFKKLFLSILTLCVFCFDTAYAGTVQPCSACASGYYCDNGSCVICSVGHYCTSNTEYGCSGNSIAPTTGMSSCTPCSGNNPYSNETHTICIACDYGAYAVINGLCRKCIAPTPYSNPSHTACVACNNGNVVDGVCQPLACSVGQYRNTNGECEDCTAGYYCMGDGEKKACPRGTYSVSGQRTCTSCPDGYTTDNVATPYVFGQNLSDICVKEIVKLRINDETVDLPTCLTPGRVNKSVVHVVQ